MTKISGYDIVLFQRKPGLWRASITSAVDERPTGVGTRQTLSVLTGDDCNSEEAAREAAVRFIRDLPKQS